MVVVASGADESRVGGQEIRLRHLTAVAIASALQCYDFLLYSFFAVQIGREFFPATDASTSLLASLAVFGTGFLMRPIGALVLGRIADQVGRKKALTIGLVIMGAAMAGQAVTPSYAEIGLAAPLLIICFRLLQGFAFGGEVGPSSAYLLEAAPQGRTGFFVSFQFSGQDIAVVLAGLVGLAVTTGLGGTIELPVSGWRVAFLLGAAALPVGLWLRRDLVETLTIASAPTRSDPATTGWRGVSLLALALMAGGTVISYIQIYLATYAGARLGLPQDIAFKAILVVGAVGVFFCPIGGWLSDRFGRRPVIILPCLALLLLGVPGFWLVSQIRSEAPLLLWSGLFAACFSMANAAILVAVAESFPARIRSSALGLVYALTVALFGGSTQFTVELLTRLTGSAMTPAWCLAAAILVLLVAGARLPKARRSGAQGNE